MANGNLNTSSGGDRRFWITALVILLVIFLAVGAYVELRPRRIRISVVKPTRQELSSSITTNGKVEPIQTFEAHAPLAVTVQKILVKEGDRVKAGQLLLVLDDTRARGDLASAQTRLKAAEEKYANLLAGGDAAADSPPPGRPAEDHHRARFGAAPVASLERLQQRGAASMDEVAAARDRVTRAQADLAQVQSSVRYSPDELSRAKLEIADSRLNVDLAEEVLRNSNIRAPFDGTVYFLPARAGAYVSIGDLLLQEADLSHVRVRAFVDEPEIGHLALGQTVKITWDALPGHTWQGTVTTLPSTVVNRGSRVVGEILCTVDNSERLLLPNVDVNTTIIASNKQDAITVPREAVHEDDGHNYVYLLLDGHLRRRDVKLGISNLTRVEIISGISGDETIAVQSYSPSPMADGVEAKVVETPS